MIDISLPSVVMPTSDIRDARDVPLVHDGPLDM